NSPSWCSDGPTPSAFDDASGLSQPIQDFVVQKLVTQSGVEALGNASFSQGLSGVMHAVLPGASAIRLGLRSSLSSKDISQDGPLQNGRTGGGALFVRLQDGDVWV